MPQTRTKKIRNATRRLPEIEQWRKAHLKLDIDHLKVTQHSYVRFRISPWTISIRDSKIPQPTGQVRRRIIESLLDIHDQWKQQLDKIGQPCYLKIWLFGPHVSQSQVVCAVGGRISYYEGIFNQADRSTLFHPEQYGTLNERLKRYRWEAHIDDIELTSDTVGEPDQYDSIARYEQMKSWFHRKAKRAYKTYTLPGSYDVFLIKKGLVWVGGQ